MAYFFEAIVRGWVNYLAEYLSPDLFKHSEAWKPWLALPFFLHQPHADTVLLIYRSRWLPSRAALSRHSLWSARAAPQSGSWAKGSARDSLNSASWSTRLCPSPSPRTTPSDWSPSATRPTRQGTSAPLPHLSLSSCSRTSLAPCWLGSGWGAPTRIRSTSTTAWPAGPSSSAVSHFKTI